MEASAILKMVEYAFYNRFFIIDVIVSNNDSTMQAVTNHPYKDAQGQVLKSSEGKLDEEIPYPSLLANTSHRLKDVANNIFSIAKESRDHKCECTRADALRLKKKCGYMIKIIGKNN